MRSIKLNTLCLVLCIVSGLALFANLSSLAKLLPEDVLPTEPTELVPSSKQQVSTTPPPPQQKHQQQLMSGKPTVIPLLNITGLDLFAQLQARNLAKASPSKPLSIYLFPLHMTDKMYLVDELKHFIHDGIMNSPYLNYTTDLHANSSDLWIAQTMLGFAPSRWCKQFLFVLTSAYRKRKERTPLILMDWHDRVDLFTCPGVVEWMKGRRNVFYTKRGIVSGRRFSGSRIETGRIETYSNWSEIAGAPVRHTPYAVRSDFVRALEQVLHHGTKSLLKIDVVGLKRPKDVVHFWPLKGLGVDRGGSFMNSKLRDAVSRLLVELAQKEGLNTYAGLAGKANLVGRNTVDLSYAKSILEYKIVVVAQKDTHEEHYRLMEAIVSGALVLSDVMLSIPKDFVDGESIVFYKDMEDLRAKIKYYLDHNDERMAIAKRGWTLAMNRHRSWHRMEEVIFGQILSPAIP